MWFHNVICFFSIITAYFCLHFSIYLSPITSHIRISPEKALITDIINFEPMSNFFLCFFQGPKFGIPYLIRHFETLFSLKRHLQSPLLNRLIYWWSRLMVWQQKYSQWTRIARKYIFFFIKQGGLHRKSPVVSGGSLFYPLNHCFYKNNKLKETRTGCNKTDVKEVINGLDPSCDEVSNTVLVHLSMSRMVRFYCSNVATISPEYTKLKVYADGLNYKGSHWN